MNIKHGGNISRETADLIKQLEQSDGGAYTYVDLGGNFTPQRGEIESFPILFADDNIVDNLPEAAQGVDAEELTALIAQGLVDIQNGGVHFYTPDVDNTLDPVTLSIIDDPEDPEYDGALSVNTPGGLRAWKAADGGLAYTAFCVSDQEFFVVGWSSHIPL